jgi:hypothetical protein
LYANSTKLKKLLTVLVEECRSMDDVDRSSKGLTEKLAGHREKVSAFFLRIMQEKCESYLTVENMLAI